jgi:hypothetical protein
MLSRGRAQIWRRNRILSQCKANGLAPTHIVLAVVRGLCRSHRVKPPPLLGRQAPPILNSDRREARIGVLNGPGQQDQLFTKQPRNWVIAGFES